MRKNRLLRIMFTCTTIMLLSACSRSTASIGGGPSQRSAMLYAWIVEGNEVRGGIQTGIELEVNTVIGVMIDRVTAAPYPASGTAFVSKYEIDFGSGWIDATDEASNWFFGDANNGVDPSHMTRYTFSEIGSFTIRGRLTFWDGEVLTTSELNDEVPIFGDKTIVILPPE